MTSDADTTTPRGAVAAPKLTTVDVPGAKPAPSTRRAVPPRSGPELGSIRDTNVDGGLPPQGDPYEGQ